MYNFNITHKLLSFNTKLFISDKYINIFEKKHNFVKFNPSIISISNKYKLICYRLWIDKHLDKQFKYPNPSEYGSPWKSGWTTYNNNNNNNNNDNDNDNDNDNNNDNNLSSSLDDNDDNNRYINLNFIGLALLEYDNINNEFNVIHDQINEIKNYKYLEDFRLYIDSNNIIKLIGNIRFNNDILNNIQFKNNNIKRGIIIFDIDNFNNIVNNIKTLNKLEIINGVVIFPEHHNYKVEKNWVHFLSDNNNDYITFNSFPFGSPIYNILYESKNTKYINNEICVNNSEYYNKLNISFFESINMYYYNCIRYSAGSCLIKYNQYENIGVGHLVINYKKLKSLYENNEINININYLMNNYKITKENAIIISNNILNIISRPKNNSYIYDFHNKNKIYMMFLYTNKNSYPFNITKISQPFTPKVLEYNTGIVFPCGICKHYDDYLISYGESDNLCCLLKITKNQIETKLFDIDYLNPASILFENYDLYEENKILNRFK